MSLTLLLHCNDISTTRSFYPGCLGIPGNGHGARHTYSGMLWSQAETLRRQVSGSPRLSFPAPSTSKLRTWRPFTPRSQEARTYPGCCRIYPTVRANSASKTATGTFLLSGKRNLTANLTIDARALRRPLPRYQRRQARNTPRAFSPLKDHHRYTLPSLVASQTSTGPSRFTVRCWVVSDWKSVFATAAARAGRAGSARRSGSV